MSGLSPESAQRLNGMGKIEFIALMALLMALNALAIDIMLPGLQEIGASLGVENENHRQYVISAYLIGFAIAQLAYGPVSDRFGRRVPMFFGLAVYIVSSLCAILVPSFAALLALRFIQGIGSAAMRVITVSIVRDIFGGRAMAEVMSLIMMVFMVVPVLAPGTGQVVMLFGEWHLIFVFMAVMAAVIGAWMYVRLPETLHPEDVRPFTARSVLEGFRIVLTDRVALCYTLASTFIFGALFGFINSAQQIYVGIYGLGVWFPVAFAGVGMQFALHLDDEGSQHVAIFSGQRPIRHPRILREGGGVVAGVLVHLVGGVYRVLFDAVIQLGFTDKPRRAPSPFKHGGRRWQFRKLSGDSVQADSSMLARRRLAASFTDDMSDAHNIVTSNLVCA